MFKIHQHILGNTAILSRTAYVLRISTLPIYLVDPPIPIFLTKVQANRSKSFAYTYNVAIVLYHTHYDVQIYTVNSTQLKKP